MASNILSGDRRWTSMRKSGMTILGKVPKPVNLPSQRLENHGLDPNVEIVPKGTLTWGTRSSSATPNAWSSSTLLSPKTDGSTVSPSHCSGRPSSGGSGTRPSTAGSDRSQEPSPNAWGSNSRPSTASGLLPSNQTPILAARPRSAETRPMVAVRPRSAETRPGSSQLSRFAENSGEPAVAWGVAKTAEKLGVASSKTDEFSLSSGDFPTLGSEKKTVSYSQQGVSSQEHSDAPNILKFNEKRQLPLSGDGVVDHENVSLPRTERNLHHDDSVSLNKDSHNNRQLAQMYENSKMTSHQFDSWHGPPVHQPDGVWYRGGSFRPAAVTPGGFPGDHFVCYPHPFPPNSEVVPRPGARPIHYQPTNGEPYCPQVLPNSYILPTNPVIATRPGPYKNTGSYDGYHSHHKATFYDSAGQRIPSTGVATQPSAYNQYPKHTGNSTSVDVQNDPSGDNAQIAEKQLSSGRTHTPYQGPYKVLLKPHANVEDNHSQEKDHYGSSTLTHSDVEHKLRGSISKEGEHSTGIRKNEMAKLGKLTTDHQAPSKLASDNERQPSNIGNITLEENSSRSSEGILKREPGNATAVVNDRKNNTVRKNAALIEKIEGLNNKVRSGDSLSVAGEFSSRQERAKQPKVVNAQLEHSATSCISTMPVSEGSSANVPKTSAILLPVPSEGSPLNIINNLKLSMDSTVATVQAESKEFSLNSLKPGEAGSHVPKRIHAAQNRGDYHSKSRLDDQPAVGWTRESSGRDPSVVSIEKKVKEEAILTSSSDSLDRQAERSKLKEMAAQRAKQLQEEEEERTREQKAKALAKLEELNKRSAAQIMKQKSNDASSPKNNVQHQEDSGVDNDSSKNIVVNPPGEILVENSDTSLQVHNDEYNKRGPSASQHSEIPVVPMGNESNTTETIAEDIVSSQSHAISGSKHKQMGFRRRHKTLVERSSVERQIMFDNLSSKHLDDVGGERNQDVKPLPLTSEKKESSRNLGEVNTHDGDSSLQHKKKNSRNSRNKSKDEGSMGSGLSSSTHSHDNVEEHLNESSKSHPAASVTETSSVHSQICSNYTKSQDSGGIIVQHHKEPSNIVEEAHGRMSNQWKQHQPSRRPARSHQVNRSLDKVHGSETVVWAPVKPANKNDQSEEINHSSIVGSNSQPLQRNEHDMHSGTRTKRAEMERYVPKPVAKELLQQENTRKPSNYVDQSASGDIPEKSYSDSKCTGKGKYDGSSIGRTDFIADTKNGVDNKPSGRGRAHASWRQRSSESTLPLQSSNESLNSSDASKPFNKPSDQHPPLPEQLKSDGWESSSNPVAKESVVTPSLTKDQGVAGRQKHQQAHRTTGNHYGNPDGKSDKSGFVAPVLDINETDTRNCMKGDNKDGAGEYIRSQGHWKPKSQTISHNPQQQTRGTARVKSETFTSPSPGIGSTHSSNENNSTLTLKDVSSAITDVGHQDSMGAKMGTCNSDLSKELMHFPKPVIQAKAALHPGDINAQQENHISSQRRHGHCGGHSNRGQEATYRSSDLIQMNEEQRKNNSHYGYQPVGSFNKTSNLYQSHSNNDQETQGHQASRQRYKERVQTQTRNPGRFVRRNTGISAHVDGSRNGEE